MKTNRLNFYLSSHGTTHLYNLFVDKNRNPPVYPIKGIPDGIHVRIHYKIKGRQMQSVLSRHDSLSRITKIDDVTFNKDVYNDYIIIYATGRGKIGGIIKKIKLIKDGKEKIFYDPDENIIENIPNIEYSYENDTFTAGLLEFKEYPDSSLEPLFLYEGECQLKDDYEYEDKNGKHKISKGEVIKIKSNDVEYLSNYFKDDPEDWLEIIHNEKELFIDKNYIKPKFYTGSAYDMKSQGFLHSTRKDSWASGDKTEPEEFNETDSYSDQSFLNMLFEGGKKNWDDELYIEYPGLKQKNLLKKYIKSKDNKTKELCLNIINIYGSHCLNPESYTEHLSFGNVIPFILGSPGLWANLFKDELYEGAIEEYKYLKNLLKDVDERLRSKERERIERVKYKLKKAEKAIKTMKLIKNQNLGIVLDEKRPTKKLKTIASIKKNRKRKTKRKTRRIKTKKNKKIKR